MKDDFKVQRTVQPSNRTVDYRTAPALSPRPARVPQPALHEAPVASGTLSQAPTQSPASTRTAQVDGPSPISQAPAAVAAPKVSDIKKRRKRLLQPFVGGFLALVILGGGGYMAADMWFSSNVVKKTTASTAAVRGDSTDALEGSDENLVSTSAIDSYKVVADAPRVLTIDSINVKARILPMGINASNAIQAPVSIFDSGWYTGSAKPGTPGVSFIDAHASGATREGLFAYLDTVKVGDTVLVERGDGEVLNYTVRKRETQKLSEINMSHILAPQDGIKEGLTLMACSGKWMADKATYDHRVIVYTERIN